jgi:hypothetical protein
MFHPPAEAVTAEDVARPNVPAATAEHAVEEILSGGSNPLSPMSTGVPLGSIGSRPSRSAGHGSSSLGHDRRSPSLTVGGESGNEKSKDEVEVV